MFQISLAERAAQAMTSVYGVEYEAGRAPEIMCTSRILLNETFKALLLTHTDHARIISTIS